MFQVCTQSQHPKSPLFTSDNLSFLFCPQTSQFPILCSSHSNFIQNSFLSNFISSPPPYSSYFFPPAQNLLLWRHSHGNKNGYSCLCAKTTYRRGRSWGPSILNLGCGDVICIREPRSLKPSASIPRGPTSHNPHTVSGISGWNEDNRA
jgi:hypothetical protein